MLEQRSVIKFVVSENSKICEIYRRIWCDVLVKTVNKLTKSGWVCFYETESKRQFRVVTHWQSGEEKVPDAAISKQNDTDCPLRPERIHHKIFLWKPCNCKQYFWLPTVSAKVPLFIECLSYHLFSPFIEISSRYVSYFLAFLHCVYVLHFNPLFFGFYTLNPLFFFSLLFTLCSHC